MAELFEISGRRRRTLFALIAAAHLLMFAWLITRPPIEQARRQDIGTLINIGPVPGETPAPEPSKPVETKPEVTDPLVPPLLDLPSPVPAAADAPAAPAVGAAGGGGGCELAVQAGAAIEQDPAAMAELTALPAGMRTEADAVLLWNQKWLDLPAPTQFPVSGQISGALRRTIIKVIVAAPAGCQNAPAIGPAFIPVRETNRTTMLVIGTGAWQWSDLVRTDTSCSPARGAPCPAVSDGRRDGQSTN